MRSRNKFAHSLSLNSLHISTLSYLCEFILDTSGKRFLESYPLEERKVRPFFSSKKLKRKEKKGKEELHTDP